MNPTDEVIIVAGKDPIGQAGGAGTYVRTMGRVARAAGFTPHIFFMGQEAATRETDIGTLHSVPSPLRHVLRHRIGEGFRNRFLPFHARPLRRAIGEFLQEREGSFVIHGVGPWSSVSSDVAHRYSSGRRRLVPVATIWTTMEDEHRAKRDGVSLSLGVAAWMRARLEYWWIRLFVWRHDRRAFRHSHTLLVNYRSVADQIDDFEPHHAPIRIVPYAAEAAFEDPLATRPEPEALVDLEPRDAPLIVAVSRHDSRKGLDVLLSALGRLRSEGIPFRAALVGPGPLLAAHRRLADRLGLGDGTAIVGFVPDPLAYLQRADVFVLPSLQEGSGSVSLLEALQCGVAVVTTAIDGMLEDATDGESALFVPPGDDEALAGALARLVEDEEQRSRLAKGARRRFEEAFSAERHTDSVRTLYRELQRGAGDHR